MDKKQIQHLTDKKSRGQAMVEFAIAFPVVMLLVFGIIELGFLLFSYSSVNTAAREAARYGIAIGDVGAAQRYYDCDGIVDAGLSIGRFAGMTESEISIAYDHGPESATISDSCTGLTSSQISSITFGDRIVVTVNHQYQPLISYMGLNINPFTMTSTSARTIFKNAEIIPGGGDGDGGGGGGGGGETCYTLTTFGQGGTALAPLQDPAPDCTDDPGKYAAGTMVTLTGQPDTASGYYTYSWIGVDSIDGADNNIAYVTMDADATVTVNYSQELLTCYSLAAPNHDGNGADPVVTNVSVSCGGGQFAEGEQVSFSAEPDTGWMTTGWTNATTSGTDTAILDMPAQDGYQVTVHYTAVDCYPINALVGGDGTGGSAPVALTESAVCGADEFMEGEEVTMQAYPSAGYDVDYWDGAAQKPLNEDQATFTMGAGIPTITVVYKEEPTLDPPSSLDVPNDFAAGDFKWNEGGGGSCTSIEFYFADSLAPSGNWPALPDYYNVYVIVDTAGGPVTSIYQVTSPQWTSGASVGSGFKISFGAEAVFLTSPTEVSRYAQVTYICYYQTLQFDGYQAK